MRRRLMFDLCIINSCQRLSQMQVSEEVEGLSRTKFDNRESYCGPNDPILLIDDDEHLQPEEVSAQCFSDT